MVALCGAGSAAFPRSAKRDSSRTRACLSGGTALPRLAARAGACGSLSRQHTVGRRPHLRRGRLLFCRRRLLPVRRRGVRERLVPQGSEARPCARARAHQCTARRLRCREAVQRARARGMASDAARRGAAFLAFAALRLPPAAPRDAGARPRPGTFPPGPGVADLGRGSLARLMQARIVETGRGARWLAEGWRMFRAAPLGWIAMVFAYWLIMTFVSIVPLVGVVAASILVPAFSVGFMAAARAADPRAPVEPALPLDGV